MSLLLQGINAVSSGLYLALAGRGVIAKEVFYNLNISELLQKGSKSVGEPLLSRFFNFSCLLLF